MINPDLKKQLGQQFQQYVQVFYSEFRRFTFEDFGDFATTLLNVYINNHLLDKEDKFEAAYYLATLFNAGMGNRITGEHLRQMAHVITNDYSVNFLVMSKINL